MSGWGLGLGSWGWCDVVEMTRSLGAVAAYGMSSTRPKA